MKVQIQYLLKAEKPDDKDWLGRKAWVVRNENGQLAFGNIYTDEDGASDLNLDEVCYLQHNTVSNKYIVVQVLA